MTDTVRRELAAAASSAPNVTCHPYYVQTTTPGHAFVRLDRIEYPNKFGGVRHWNVVVLMPQDASKAEAWLEEFLPPLREALAPHLVVTTATPQQLQITGAGVLPCVFINGHREE